MMITSIPAKTKKKRCDIKRKLLNISRVKGATKNSSFSGPITKAPPLLELSGHQNVVFSL